jgi:hypothetical protein
MVKLESLGMNLEDAQFIESRKFNRAEVAGIFGAPLSLIDGSYAAYEKIDFVTIVLGSIGSLIEQEYTLKLLNEDEISDGVRFRFDWSESLRLDPSKLAEVQDKELRSGVKMINEARAVLGLPPVPGGDIPLIEGERIKLEDAGVKYTGGNSTAEPPVAAESLAGRLAPVADDWLSRSNTKALNAFKRIEKKHTGEALRAAVADLERQHREFVVESGETIARAYAIDGDKFYGMASRYVAELIEGFETADSKEDNDLRQFSTEQAEQFIRKLRT